MSDLPEDSKLTEVATGQALPLPQTPMRRIALETLLQDARARKAALGIFDTPKQVEALKTRVGDRLVCTNADRKAGCTRGESVACPQFERAALDALSKLLAEQQPATGTRGAELLAEKAALQAEIGREQKGMDRALAGSKR